MVLRQARLIASLLLAAILIAALVPVLSLGPDTPFAESRDGSWYSAGTFGLWLSANALFCMLVYGAAARIKRWRRNIVRSGGVFAISWIGSLALMLEKQLLNIARAAGHPVDGATAMAILIACLLLLRANQLPKSRPAWFNGVTLPPFAPDPMVWRQIHRASAFRVMGIALFILGALAIGPPGSDPRPFVIALLIAEVIATSLHGLWLTHRRPSPPLVSRS